MITVLSVASDCRSPGPVPGRRVLPQISVSFFEAWWLEKGILFIAMLSAFICGINLTLIGPLETWIVEDLAISHSLAGLIQTSFFVGNLAGSLAAVWISSNYKLRGKISGVTALFMMGVGCLLSGSRHYELIVFGRFVAGIGNSLTVIFFTAVIVQNFENLQAPLLNMFHGILAIGAVLSMVGARQIADFLGGWPVSFWLTGGISLLLAAWLSLHTLPAMGKGEHISYTAVRRIMANPIVMACFFIFIGYNIAEEGTVTFFAAFAEKERNFPVTSSVQMASLYWAGVGLGRIVSVFTSKKIAERPQIIGYSIIGSILLLSTLAVSGRFMISTALFLGGVALGPVIPLMFSYIVRQVGYLKTSVVSLSNLVCCLGGSIGPALAGLVGDNHSLFLGLVTVYLVFLVSVGPFVMRCRKT